MTGKNKGSKAHQTPGPGSYDYQTALNKSLQKQGGISAFRQSDRNQSKS